MDKWLEGNGLGNPSLSISHLGWPFTAAFYIGNSSGQSLVVFFWTRIHPGLGLKWAKGGVIRGMVARTGGYVCAICSRFPWEHLLAISQSSYIVVITKKKSQR